MHHTGRMGLLDRFRRRGHGVGSTGATCAAPTTPTSSTCWSSSAAARRRGLRRAPHHGHRRDAAAGGPRRRVDPAPGAVGAVGARLRQPQRRPVVRRGGWSASRTGCASTTAPAGTPQAAARPRPRRDGPSGSAPESGLVAAARRSARALRRTPRAWGCRSRSPRTGTWPHGPPVFHAGPAMSRCAHGRPSTNSLEERRGEQRASPSAPSCAAAGRRPCSRCGPPRGSRRGSAAATAARRSSRAAACTAAAVSSSPKTPATWSPSATMHGPVRVATSTIDVGVVLGGHRERVGQDQPALGVGVGHLDGLAAVHRQHVAGAHRARRRSCSPPSARRW